MRAGNQRLALYVVAAAVLVAFASFSGTFRPSVAEAAPAGNLRVTSVICSGGFITANFAWNADAGSQQWLDLTTLNTNFAPNTFAGWGPLSGSQSSLAWPGLFPNTNYYVRVNTFAGVWQPSQTILFNTGSCGSAPAGATNLRVASQDCQAGNWVQANFLWTPSNQVLQYFDLTTANTNFAAFTFASMGALPPGQGNLSWPGLFPNTTYYVRVNTFVGTGWIATQLSFTTRACQGSGGPATNLNLVAQQCQTKDFVIGIFNWTPSNTGSQWLELTTVNANFAAGTYASWGPLSANQNSLAWPGLFTNTTYYVRVATFTGSGWFVSPTLTFKTAVCQQDFTTSDKVFDGAATGPDPAILDDVDVSGHPDEGFDRIVFEFDGAFPDGLVEYVDEASECGSGDPVDLDGDAILVVRLEPAAAHVDGTLTAPTSVAGTGVQIEEAVQICDFEGVVAWAIGIDDMKGFRVTLLTNPNRLVIDILR